MKYFVDTPARSNDQKDIVDKTVEAIIRKLRTPYYDNSNIGNTIRLLSEGKANSTIDNLFSKVQTAEELHDIKVCMQLKAHNKINKKFNEDIIPIRDHYLNDTEYHALTVDNFFDKVVVKVDKALHTVKKNIIVDNNYQVSKEQYELDKKELKWEVLGRVIEYADDPLVTVESISYDIAETDERFHQEYVLDVFYEETFKNAHWSKYDRGRRRYLKKVMKGEKINGIIALNWQRFIQLSAVKDYNPETSWVIIVKNDKYQETMPLDYYLEDYSKALLSERARWNFQDYVETDNLLYKEYLEYAEIAPIPGITPQRLYRNITDQSSAEGSINRMAAYHQPDIDSDGSRFPAHTCNPMKARMANHPGYVGKKPTGDTGWQYYAFEKEEYESSLEYITAMKEWLKTPNGQLFVRENHTENWVHCYVCDNLIRLTYNNYMVCPRCRSVENTAVFGVDSRYMKIQYLGKYGKYIKLRDEVDLTWFTTYQSDITQNVAKMGYNSKGELMGQKLSEDSENDYTGQSTDQ